jgi:hypothetical protein
MLDDLEAKEDAIHTFTVNLIQSSSNFVQS